MRYKYHMFCEMVTKTLKSNRIFPILPISSHFWMRTCYACRDGIILVSESLWPYCVVAIYNIYCQIELCYDVRYVIFNPTTNLTYTNHFTKNGIWPQPSFHYTTSQQENTFSSIIGFFPIISFAGHVTSGHSVVCLITWYMVANVLLFSLNIYMEYFIF